MTFFYSIFSTDSFLKLKPSRNSFCVCGCVLGGGGGREQGVLCVRERVKVLVQKNTKQKKLERH